MTNRKSNGRQRRVLGSVEILARHGTNVVVPRRDNDLIEFISPIPHESDAVAEVDTEKSDEPLIVHGSDLLDMRLERIQPSLGRVGVVEAQVFDVVDPHTELLQAMAYFSDCHCVHAGKHMLVAECEGGTGFRFPDRMKKKRTLGLE